MRALTEPCPACSSIEVQIIPKRKVDLSPAVCMLLVAIVLPAAGSEFAGSWGFAVGAMVSFWLLCMAVAYTGIETMQFTLHCEVCDLVWFVFPWQLPKIDSF